MEKNSKISWKDIIQWEVISTLVNEAFDDDIEINDEIRQESLTKFEELHSEEEINEMDFDDIEDEMIDILVEIFDDGTHKGKGGREVLIEIKGNSKLNDLNYLAKMMERNPNLKRVFQRQKKKNIDDDEDDNKSNMYI